MAQPERSTIDRPASTAAAVVSLDESVVATIEALLRDDNDGVEQALGCVARYFGADSVELWSLEHDHQRIVLSATWRGPDGVGTPPHDVVLPFTDPVLSPILDASEPAFWQRHRDDGRVVDAAGEPLDAWLCAAPIGTTQGRPRGCLTLICTEETELDAEGQWELMRLAALFGPLREEPMAGVEVARRRWLEQFLATTSKFLLDRASGDHENDLHRALGWCGRVLDAEVVSMFTVDGDDFVRRVGWGRGGVVPFAGPRVAVADIPEDADPRRRLVAASMPVASGPAQIVEAYEAAGLGEAEMLHVPLVFGNVVEGLLVVVTAGPRNWTAEEIAALESLARIVHTHVERMSAERTLRRRASEAEVIAELGRHMLAGHRVSTVEPLLAGLSVIADHVGADTAVYLRRDGDVAVGELSWSRSGVLCGVEARLGLDVERRRQLGDRKVHALSAAARAELAPQLGGAGAAAAGAAMADGEVFGLLVVLRNSAEPFEDGDDYVLATAAAELGMLFLRRSTEQKLTRTAELDELRSEIAASFVEVGADRFSEVVTEALAKVARTVGAPMAARVWRDPVSGAAEVRELWFGEPGAVWLGTPLSLSSEMVDALAASSGPFAMRLEQMVVGVSEVSAGAVATVTPARRGGDAVGAVVLVGGDPANGGSLEQELLTDISRLVHQLERRTSVEAETVRRSAYDDLRVRVARRFLERRADDPDEGLRWALSEIGRVFNAHSVVFAEIDVDYVRPVDRWLAPSLTDPDDDVVSDEIVRRLFPSWSHVFDGSPGSVVHTTADDPGDALLPPLDGAGPVTQVAGAVRTPTAHGVLAVTAFERRQWGPAELATVDGLVAQIRQFLDTVESRRDVQARLGLEDLHSGIAGALVSADESRIDDLTEWVLTDLATYLGSSWACLLTVEVDANGRASAEVTHGWPAGAALTEPPPELAARLVAASSRRQVPMTTATGAATAIPIVVDGRVVGALCAASRPDTEWRSAELDTLRSVGRLLHVAERRISAELAVARRAQLEDVVARAAAVLVEADDPDEVVPAVLEEVGQFFGAVEVNWLRVDNDERALLHGHAWRADGLRTGPLDDGRLVLCPNDWALTWSRVTGPFVAAAHEVPKVVHERRPGRTKCDRILVPTFSGSRPVALLAIAVEPGQTGTAADLAALQSLATVINEVLDRARADRLFSTTFRSAPTGQVLLGADGVVRAANDSFRRLVGGDPVGTLLSAHVEGADDGWWPTEGEWRLTSHPHASWVRFRSAVAHVQGDNDPLTIVHAEDVTADRRNRERLRFEATHDELTGLGNRRLLMEELAQAITHREDAAVLLVDVDRFKVVNDSLGHTAGDAVLVRIADRLRLSIREDDLVCRFGGDEFAVLLRSTDAIDEIAATAQRLISVIRKPVEVRGTTVMPTCSLGIAVAASGDDVESVLRHADAALYEAKGRGRDRYEFFDDDHRESLRARLALETSLRQGVLDGRFVPWYQPEYDIETGEIVSLEALVRWDHPDRGIVAAASFIDVAEEIGLAPELSRLVLDEACAALERWSDAGHRARVRVNVAAAQLQSDELEMQILTALARHRLQPDQLCLEITERSLMLDVGASVATLERIRAIGVEVAVDDFGTGFSALAWLKGLPVDTLKIDRSFVSGLCDGRVDREIVRTIIWLARALDLDVVAEGVEQEREVAILRGLGCRRAQGWLWSPAVPDAEIPGLLEAARV